MRTRRQVLALAFAALAAASAPLLSHAQVLRNIPATAPAAQLTVNSANAGTLSTGSTGIVRILLLGFGSSSADVRFAPGVRILSLDGRLLPPGSVSALHIYFPDPWPKKKHARHRLINERFPLLAKRVLAPRGIVYLRTDDRDYFLQMNEVFGAAAAYQKTVTPPDLAAITTDFEREFNAQGIPTQRVAYQLK